MPDTDIPVPVLWREPEPGCIVLKRLLRCDDASCIIDKITSSEFCSNNKEKCEQVVRRVAEACRNNNGKLSWNDGINIYLMYRGKQGPVKIPDELPERIRGILVRVLEAADRARLRPVDIIVDAELLHIVFTAGCGMATLSIAPDGTVAFTNGDGVELIIQRDGDGYNVLTLCKDAPRYIDIEKYIEEFQ